MGSRKTKIMPYIFVCGMGILNLILMALPFVQDGIYNYSGYLLISMTQGTLGAITSIFQVLIMLLLFFMMIYGAIGILYATGVSGVDMSKRGYRLFCGVPIVLLDLLYLLQFILIIALSAKSSFGVGIGTYMAFFLNISITIVFTALLKEPTQRPQPRKLSTSPDLKEDESQQS